MADRDGGGSSTATARVLRACDQCNVRKIKCRPSNTPGNSSCSTCERSDIACTRLKEIKKRGPNLKRLPHQPGNHMDGRRSASPQRSTSALEESNRDSPSQSDDGSRLFQGADRVHPDNVETGPTTYRGLRGWPPIEPLGSDATGFDRHHLDGFSKRYSPREDRPPLDSRQTIDDGFDPEPTLPASRFPPPEIPDSSNPSAIDWASGGAAPFTHQFDHNMSGQAGASTSEHVPPSLFAQSESIPTVGPTGIDVDFRFDNWSNMIYTGGGLLCDQELMNAIASFQSFEEIPTLEQNVSRSDGQGPSTYDQSAGWIGHDHPILNVSEMDRHITGASTLNHGRISATLPKALQATLERYPLPPDDYIAARLKWYFDVFQRFVPLVERRDIEGAFERRAHHTDPRLRLVLLALLAVCETSESINGTQDYMLDRHTTSEQSEQPSPPPVQALTTLGRVTSLPPDPAKMCSEHIIANIAAFASWDMKRDRKASWFYLQQAISFVQLLGLDSPEYYRDLPDEHKVLADLKLFYTVYTIERGHLLIRQAAVNHSHNLRLQGSAWQDTESIRLVLPPDALDRFPVEQVRLFRLVDSRALTCWHKPCSLSRGYCSKWTLEEAITIWNELYAELVTATECRPSAEDSDRHVFNVNLVFTVAWLSDRFWNLWREHGLMGPSNRGRLGLEALHSSVLIVGNFCRSVRPAHLDPTRDWTAKLSDMGMSAINVIKRGPAPWFDRAEDASYFDQVKQDLLSVVYRFISLLTMCGDARVTQIPLIVKALADIV